MNLENIYSLRKDYTVIAITGRTGSGCSEVTRCLSDFNLDNTDIFPNPSEFPLVHNSFRKYRIVHSYSLKNRSKYVAIYYKTILSAFIIKYPLEELIQFLKSNFIIDQFKDSKLTTIADFKAEIEQLNQLEKQFNSQHEIAKELIVTDKKSKEDLVKLYNFFASDDFKSLDENLNSILMKESLIKRNKILQLIANNIRATGHPYQYVKSDLKHVFGIAEIINDLIKSIEKRNLSIGSPTKIVIDSLRNPFEIMFFRQRFSAFYTFAINREDEKRTEGLRDRICKINPDKCDAVWDDMKLLMVEEHSLERNNEFFKQNVSACIQNADIHINFLTKAEAETNNRELVESKENRSPYFSYGMQLLKFISLIEHPGIITPSPEERCMQVAYTAKYNSGCISRQVGATITDQNYSIKAIGWNNTPEGHVPCVLRNIKDLFAEPCNDEIAFTPYEKQNPKFRYALKRSYKRKIDEHDDELKGQNVSFCFKSIINSYADGKNQVHTRSLHAEESAFLQITKYGGQGILNGMLFTTASPCELCAKKAYQLGIKVIYYIDPYPGISEDQILKAGNPLKNPSIRLFFGAIGNAYHWLYEPVMSYKDELALILETKIIDVAKRNENKYTNLKKRYIKMRQEKKQLENIISDLKGEKH